MVLARVAQASPASKLIDRSPLGSIKTRSSSRVAARGRSKRKEPATDNVSKEVTKPTDFDRASFDESLRSWQDKQQGKEWVLSGLLEGSEDSKEQNEAHEEAWPTNACLIANVSVLATGIATALFGGSDFSNDVFTRLMYSATEVSTANVRGLYTSLFLFSGIVHFALNCTALYVLEPKASKAFGRGTFYAIYFLSGIAGTAATYLLSSTSFVVAGSFPVFGTAAAIAAYHTRKQPRQIAWRQVLPIAGLLFINILFGANEDFSLVENTGQISSFFAGLWFAWLLMPEEEQPHIEADQQPSAQLASAAAGERQAGVSSSRDGDNAQSASLSRSEAELEAIAAHPLAQIVLVTGCTFAAVAALVAARSVSYSEGAALMWLDAVQVDVETLPAALFDRAYGADADPDLRARIERRFESLETPWPPFDPRRAAEREHGKLLLFDQEQLEEDEQMMDDPEGLPMDWQPHAHLA